VHIKLSVVIYWLWLE